ncbi:MAG: hypothetical protein HYU37_08985 [Acidobacteria bacterium]|nr:hypothetical protein [Acidobacteriota bacterium]
MPVRRLYVVNLERGIQQKRVFLEGDDTEEARAQLNAVMQSMSRLAASSPNWFDFLKEATQQFTRAGFLRVAH